MSNELTESHDETSHSPIAGDLAAALRHDDAIFVALTDLIAPEPEQERQPFAEAQEVRGLDAWAKGTIGECDEILGVIAELLGALKRLNPRGSQTRIFVDAAAVATQRATKLTRRLLDDR